MGHSSIRVTQEIYVHVASDVYDRFYAATTNPGGDNGAHNNKSEEKGASQ